MKCIFAAIITFCLLSIQVQAQDLEPRAYVRAPVKASVITAGIGYSDGGVVTDATLPVKDVHATINSAIVGAAHVFGMLGQTAQVAAAIPYLLGEVTGSVADSAQRITRSGFGDLHLRLSWLVHGAPTVTAAEFAKAPKKTILGTSLTIVAPTGQYLYGKLVNLSTNRWSFKPELALSQPLGERWLCDLYAGVWFFTNNNSFYPGNSVRSQSPMGSFQAHLSYNIGLRAWAAFDLTFYVGGSSSVNGVTKNDRQESSRVGGIVVLPIGKRNSVKVAFSTGAIIRFGANFTTISVGWQSTFLGKSKKS